MSYEKLRKVKPEIHDINQPGSPDPRFHGVKTQVPVKLIANTKNDPQLARLYSTGPLKWEDTGRTCSNCYNFYPDPNLGKGVGRCKARGFMEVHEDTPADDKPKGWTDPRSGATFRPWPGCPLYSEKNRSSRR